MKTRKKINTYLLPYCLVFLLSQLPFYCFSQENEGLFIDGQENIEVLSVEGDLYVEGKLSRKESSSNKLRIGDAGKLQVTGDLDARGTNKMFSSSLGGKIVLFGNQEQNLTSSSYEFGNFPTIEFDKSSGKILVNGNFRTRNLIATNGVFDLQSSNVYLYDEGKLINERNEAYVTASTGKLISDVAIQNASNTPLNFSGLGLSVSSTIDAGSWKIERSHEFISSVGNGSIQRSYNLVKLPTSLSIQKEIDFSIIYLDHEKDSLLARNSAIDLGSFALLGNQWRRKGDEFLGKLTSWDEGVLTIASNNCQAFNSPLVDFDQYVICEGDSIEIQLPQISGLIYFWNEVEGASKKIFDSNTNQSVEILSNNGCNSTDNFEIVVRQNPIALPIVPISVCENEVIELADTSMAVDGTIAKLIWKVNNQIDTIAAGESLSIPTNTIGIVSGELTVVNSFQCSSTTPFSGVYVHAKPIARLESVDETCAEKEVNLKSISSNPYANSPVDLIFKSPIDKNKTLLSINDVLVNDGTQNEHQITWNTAGLKKIKLIVSTFNNCTDTLIKNITVHAKPIAGFTIDATCSGTEVVANSTATKFDSELWKFKNHWVSNSYFTYNVAGDYEIEQAVSTNFGCSDSAIQTVTIYPTPVIDFTWTGSCDNEEINFTSSLTESVPNLTFDWSIDGVNRNDQKSFNHSALVNGNYDVKVRVASEFNCIDSIQKQISIHKSPVIDFTTTDHCEEETMTVSITQNEVYDLDWGFGNGESSTENNVNYVYPIHGIYEIDLIATTVENCSTEVRKFIEVFEKPVSNLPRVIQSCQNIKSVDVTTALITDYLWSTGSTGSVDTLSVNGNYQVVMTTKDGCSVTDGFDLFLNQISSLDLGIDTTVCDQLLLDAQNNNVDYLWSDGSTNRTLVVEESGRYFVTVKEDGDLTNSFCLSTDTIDVVLDQTPVFTLIDSVHLCIGESHEFDLSSIDALQFDWSNGISLPMNSASSTGWFSLKTSNNECFYSDSTYVAVHEMPTLELGENDTSCNPIEVVPQMSSLILSFVWEDGIRDATRTLDESGIYRATIKTEFGCSAFDSIQVTILEKPVIDSIADLTACETDSVAIEVTGMFDFISWSDGSTSRNRMLASGSNYTIVANSLNGCFVTEQFAIKKVGPSEIDLGEDGDLCFQESVLIQPDAQHVLIHWKKNDSFWMESSEALIEEPGTYIAWVEGDGCSYSDTVTFVQSEYAFQAHYLGATELFVGDTLQLVETTVPEIENANYYWDFGDGIVSYEEHPQHIYFNEGEYDLQLVVENQRCSDTLTKTFKVLRPAKNNEIDEWATNDLEFIKMKLYPNPSDGNFTVLINYDLLDQMELSVFNGVGQLVHRKSVMVGEKNEFSLDLATGVYWLSVQDGNYKRTMKMVITK